MLYSPLDLDLTAPPHHPHNLTVFAHARWRFPRLAEEIAKAKAVQEWKTVEDFRRWEATLSQPVAGIGWSEDSGGIVPRGYPREEARRVGGVWDRGYRTGHLLCRPGETPRVGWSSYLKLFSDAPARLSEVQEATGHIFTLLRSLDLAIWAHDEMPESTRQRVRRVVVYGLPESVADEPKTKAALDFWKVVRDKQKYHDWQIEIRECSAHQNPAAFLSGCYAAPILRSPIRNSYLRPFGNVTFGGGGDHRHASQGDNTRLLQAFERALEDDDTDALAMAFAAAVSQVNQRRQTLVPLPPKTPLAPAAGTGEQTPPVLGRLLPVPHREE